VNTELADLFGNLLLRCVSDALNPTHTIPAPGPLGDLDTQLVACINTRPGNVDHAMLDFDTQAALSEIVELLQRTNQYVQFSEPWKLTKPPKPTPDAPGPETPEAAQLRTQRLATVLYVMTEALRVAATLLIPFIPTAANVVLDHIAVPPENRYVQFCVYGALPPGRTFPQAKPVLFQKIKVEEAQPSIAEQREKKREQRQTQIGASKKPKAKKPAAAAPPEPPKEDPLKKDTPPE
jgi:methionyl-tRNA synthetase